MFGVTQDYVDAINSRNRYMRYRLDILDDVGHTLHVSGLLGSTDLRFKSGSVTADATATSRRQATFQLIDPKSEFTSVVGDSLLSSTSGNSFKLWAGPVLLN